MINLTPSLAVVDPILPAGNLVRSEC